MVPPGAGDITPPGAGVGRRIAGGPTMSPPQSHGAPEPTAIGERATEPSTTVGVQQQEPQPNFSCRRQRKGRRQWNGRQQQQPGPSNNITRATAVKSERQRIETPPHVQGLCSEQGRTPPSLGIDSSRRIRRPQSPGGIPAVREPEPASLPLKSMPPASSQATAARDTAIKSYESMGKVFGLTGMWEKKR
jgi:hypothetical protein